jgi:hypothetical protein
MSAMSPPGGNAPGLDARSSQRDTVGAEKTRVARLRITAMDRKALAKE